MVELTVLLVVVALEWFVVMVELTLRAVVVAAAAEKTGAGGPRRFFNCTCDSCDDCVGDRGGRGCRGSLTWEDVMAALTMSVAMAKTLPKNIWLWFLLR